MGGIDNIRPAKTPLSLPLQLQLSLSLSLPCPALPCPALPCLADAFISCPLFLQL
jgi:hypothetical protein